jgi:hypothetical protein
VRLLRLERIQLQTNATGQSAFPNVRVKKQPKNLRRRKSIIKKKKMKKSKPNKPTKKIKWPDTQLTPSQPVRQKNSKILKEKFFRRLVKTIQQNVCPAFLSGWLFTCRISSQLKNQFLGPSLCCLNYMRQFFSI